MHWLFVVHSVLRYLVLLFGIGALFLAVAVVLGKSSLEKPFKGITSAYLGTLHLQVLVGVGVVFTRPWFPALIGHIVMMVAAAVTGQVLVSVAKRKQPMSARMMLLGIGLSLVFIAGGIFAIGRHPFQTTAF